MQSTRSNDLDRANRMFGGCPLPQLLSAPESNQKSTSTTGDKSPQQDQPGRKPLRVLMLEDTETDAKLVQRWLVKAGYDTKVLRIENAIEFAEALASGDWDVIIADYTIPRFGAMPALEMLKQSGLDIPFIIISGVITDETAVAAMRAGAHDYVLKDNMTRLVPAIEREMQEASSRRQKRQTEQALKYASAIIESSDDAIIAKTLDGIITTWNGGAERLYGYKPVEMIGRSISALMPEGGSTEAKEILDRFISGEHIQHFEANRRCKDGTLVQVAVKISPIFNLEGNIVGVSSIARDISERKRTEQALVRSEKLASVGRMAATIAHEINNPLAAAMNALFLASMSGELPEATVKNLQIAGHELQRVAHITKQTLGFYREGGKPGAVDLSKVVGSVCDLYESKLKNKSVSVKTHFRDSVVVRGIEGELRQVVSNLVANSIDALPTGGQIWIRTTCLTSSSEDSVLRLTIADNGTGIAPEHRKRIFEPFFTSKELVGTGLGLWATRELVHKHSGQIKVRSLVGKGTVFSIWLPMERRTHERDEPVGSYPAGVIRS